MKLMAIDVRDRASPPRIVVFFSAPHRVDFRQLLRELSNTLSSKIELRQVGARDAARVQGGIGPCGRDLCCATFLTDFEPVSVRMAKDQDLPVNPLNISGACGRLMCCLKYEHPLYQEFKAAAPAVGATVGTPEGDGRVLAHEVPLDGVVVRLTASGQTCRCSRADVCAPRRAYDDTHRTPTGATQSDA
jgi:cell fate regulator YaaT (PSP1 superfamily)